MSGIWYNSVKQIDQPMAPFISAQLKSEETKIHKDVKLAAGVSARYHQKSKASPDS